MQSWNLSGLPGNRKASIGAEGAVLAAEARAAALSHRLAAAQAWMELWAAQQSLADALQESELAREFSSRMAHAAAAAAFTRAEAADAATYAAEAHVLAIAAEGEVVGSWLPAGGEHGSGRRAVPGARPGRFLRLPRRCAPTGRRCSRPPGSSRRWSLASSSETPSAPGTWNSALPGAGGWAPA